MDAPRAGFSAECLDAAPVITGPFGGEEGCLCPGGGLRNPHPQGGVSSRPHLLEHLLMVLPHSVMKHDMRQSLLPDEDIPKDFGQIFQAPPAKVLGL